MKQQWDTHAFIELFEANRNQQLAIPMAAYMKNQFPFLGIKTPLRKQLLTQYLAEHHLPQQQHITSVVMELYRLPEREYQYAAIAVLERMKAQLSKEDLAFLRRLIESKSWWDSVDAIAPRIVGHIVMNNRIIGKQIMLDWSQADNMWTNRAAILHQLKFKGQTDTAALSSIISKHAESSEFFIQKSIGWALREYAKTDSEWVRQFVAAEPLQALSKREALKNITKKSPTQ